MCLTASIDGDLTAWSVDVAGIPPRADIRVENTITRGRRVSLRVDGLKAVVQMPRWGITSRLASYEVFGSRFLLQSDLRERDCESVILPDLEAWYKDEPNQRVLAIALLTTHFLQPVFHDV